MKQPDNKRALKEFAKDIGRFYNELSAFLCFRVQNFQSRARPQALSGRAAPRTGLDINNEKLGFGIEVVEKQT